MDREHFDALTRLFSTRGSRRAALATALGGVLLGRVVDPAEAGRKRKGKHHKRQRQDEDDDDNGQDEQCYPGTDCRPGQGRTNAGCDFSGSTTFAGRNVRGAILAGANFTGADASGADLRGAVLTDACLVNADLREARIDESTVLDGAIFCHTVLPDGSIDDTGCSRETPCCPTSPPGGGAPLCRDDSECTNAGELCCDGRCIDVRFDPLHCGNCRRFCDLDNAGHCVEGICINCVVCADPRQCQYQSVGDAIKAGNFAVITVCPGIYKEHVHIDVSCQVVGLGRSPGDVVLDGEGRPSPDAVLSVGEFQSATVRNLTVKGGNASGQFGGGVVNLGELTLQNVHVTDNTAPNFAGGGISNVGTSARLILENTLVGFNTAGDGGGISNGRGHVTLRRGTTVTDNNALQGGGIINRGTLTLEGTRVVHNIAQSGGGIENRGGDVTLTQQSFVQSNIVRQISAGPVVGGGINNVAGSVTFIGEAFVNDNTATGGAGSGGGILNRGTVTSDNRPIATLVVDNSPDDCVNADSGTGCPA